MDAHHYGHVPLVWSPTFPFHGIVKHLLGGVRPRGRVLLLELGQGIVTLGDWNGRLRTVLAEGILLARHRGGVGNGGH